MAEVLGPTVTHCVWLPAPRGGVFRLGAQVVFASVSAVLLGAGELGGRVLLGGSLILLAALLSTVSFGNRSSSSHG